jgi:hypothetical protein
VPLYLPQSNLQVEGLHPIILNLRIEHKMAVSITPQPFCPRLNLPVKIEHTLCGAGEALDILRKDKMLAHAGIQTPDGPSPSQVITPTTLCLFQSTLAAGLLKCYINYPARNPQDSHIGLLTFGTVHLEISCHAACV